MKKLLTTVIVFLTVLQFSLGQVTFEKYYGYGGFNPQSNTAPVLINSKDSGYFLFSWNADSGSSTVSNFWLALSRLDKDGKIVWSKTSDKYTENNTWAYGSANMLYDSSFFIGWNQGDGVGLSYGGLIHLDKTGNCLWAKRYYLPYDTSLFVPAIFINAIQRTHDNGALIIGEYHSEHSDSTSMFLMRVDSAGNIKWCKGYYPVGITDVSATNINVISNNSCIVDFSAVDTSLGWSYGCLMKIDSNGVPLWTRRYYPWFPEWASSQVVNNNIYTVGFYTDTANFTYNNYAAVLKTNNIGIPQSCDYDTTLNMTYSGTVYGGLSENNGTLISGDSGMNANSFIAKIDNGGNFRWAYKYNKVDSLIISNLALGLDSSVIGFGWNEKPNSEATWGIVKTNKIGVDSCNTPTAFNMVHLNIKSQATTVATVLIKLIVKDTVLNFHVAPVDTLTVCEGHYIVDAGINNLSTNTYQ